MADFLSLYGIGASSTGDEAASAIAAALYLIPLLAVIAQIIFTRGRQNLSIMIYTALFALVRTIAFAARVAAERKHTKLRDELYLVLFGAATFLIIGVVTNLLSLWWVKSSGFAVTTLGSAAGGRGPRLVSKLTVPLFLKLLHLLGVVFAVIAIDGAVKLFSNNLTEARFNTAQRERTAAGAGFVAIVGIDIVFWAACVALSARDAPNESDARPRRFTVAVVMLGASVLLLWKTIVALVAVHKRSLVNKSGTLYALDVLPELLCLWIVVLPPILLGVGKDERPRGAPQGSALVEAAGNNNMVELPGKNGYANMV